MTLPDDTEALLDALDRVRDRPGSVDLFDALAANDPPGVQRAAASHPQHPLFAGVAVWLAARGLHSPEPPSVTEVLAKHGITDLEAHLVEEARRTRQHTKGLEEAWARVKRAEMVADAYAAVLVLIVMVAIVGWAVAIDLVPLGAVPELPDTPEGAPERAPR